MLKSDEPAFLLRVDAQLPVDLKLKKRNFREVWESVPPSYARVFGKRVQRFEWQIVAEAEPLLTGGLGKTREAATAGALTLALRQVSESFNAARVEYLRVEQYPWFYLATVAVYPQAIRKALFFHCPPGPVAAQPDHSTAPPPLGIAPLFLKSGKAPDRAAETICPFNL